MRPIRVLLSTYLSILISLSFILGYAWLPLQAQEPNKPMLRITDINIDAFPQVEVSVYGQNLGDPLASIPIRVEEGNVEREVESDFRNIGVQVAVVVDASRNIRSPGLTGDPRHTEIANVIRAFLDLGVLSSETDWLSSYTIGPGSDGFMTLTDWTQDHNVVANELFQYTSSDNQPTTTSLFGLIKFAMDRFDNTGIPANVLKQIVIFSDGSDVVSSLERDDITNRADASNITINTVLIGDDNFRGAAENLDRIATLTRGSSHRLEDVSALNGLWQEIAQQRGQRILSYRTDNREPGTLQVIARRPNGLEITHEVNFPRPGARSPRVVVLQPESGRTIVREGDSPDMPLEDMTEGTLSIEVAFEWPDGYEREPVRVEYRLNNRTLPVEQPPFDRFDISIAELPAGDYTLLVSATDELGLKGESQSVPFTVIVNRPTPLPTDTPVPTIDPTTVPTITATPIITDAPTITPTAVVTPVSPPPSTILDIIAERVISAVQQTTGTTLSRNEALLLSLFPFILLLIGLIYGLRRGKPVESRPYDFSELSSGDDFSTDPQHTEPDNLFGFESDTEPIAIPPEFVRPPAHLVYVDGGDHLPRKIPVDGGREIKIGRSEIVSELIIEDRRVSKLHASIIEQNDGFYIQDEGSSGGTFVNRRKLGISDTRPLRDGDIINFNVVAYRFELTKDDDDNTEPAATTLELNN